MKLYTQEQVVNALNRVFIESITIEDVNEVMRSLTPIELPSDEEIDKQAEHEDTYSKKCAFTRGAKWVGRKFGGNNEQ